MKTLRVRCMIMMILIVAQVFGILTFLASFNVTKTICAFAVFIITVVCWVKYETAEYEKRCGIGNYEEVVLARSFQANGINKMHRNVILFLTPILIFGSYAFNDNIIHKDYTNRVNNNIDVCMEIITAADIGVSFDKLFNDPVASAVIREGRNKSGIIMTSLFIDTAMNMQQTTSLVYSVKRELENNESISEEFKIDIIKQLEEVNAHITDTYNKILIADNGSYVIDKLLQDLKKTNYTFVEINSATISSLKDNTLTSEKFKNSLYSYITNLKDSYEGTLDSMELTLQEEQKYIVIDMILFRIAWLTSIIAVIRLLGICGYYIKLRKFRKNISTN